LVSSFDKDIAAARRDLRKIEKDLAFEVVESYRDRRMEDFQRLCRVGKLGQGA